MKIMFSMQDYSTLTRTLSAAKVAIKFESGTAWLEGKKIGLRSAESSRGAVYMIITSDGGRLSMPIYTIEEAARDLISMAAKVKVYVS